MATEAQIAANRKNAQLSTGPRTDEGKARASGNAVSLGLFTRQNCVQPQEQDEYNNLYNTMWQNLSPAGAMEEMFATEIIRGAWRLRRCATAEADLSKIVEREVRRNQAKQQAQDPETEPFYRAWDPVIYDHRARTQAAIDRARTQTAGIVRRATADLRRLQNERLFRAATFPEDADASRFGLASFTEVLPKINNEAKDQLLAVITSDTVASEIIEAVEPAERNTNRTESPAPIADPDPRYGPLTEARIEFMLNCPVDPMEDFQSAA
jgi:hypothetical protein